MNLKSWFLLIIVIGGRKQITLILLRIDALFNTCNCFSWLTSFFASCLPRRTSQHEGPLASHIQLVMENNDQINEKTMPWMGTCPKTSKPHYLEVMPHSMHLFIIERQRREPLSIQKIKQLVKHYYIFFNTATIFVVVLRSCVYDWIDSKIWWHFIEFVGVISNYLTIIDSSFLS